GSGGRGARGASRCAIRGVLRRGGALAAAGTVGGGAGGGDTSRTCTVIRVEGRATGLASRVRQTATAITVWAASASAHRRTPAQRSPRAGTAPTSEVRAAATVAAPSGAARPRRARPTS